MFSKLWTFGPFFARITATVEHDVEAIIGDFNATVTKLEAAAEAKLAEAEDHTLTSIHYEQLADTAHLAAEKAQRVATQIKALVA